MYTDRHLIMHPKRNYAEKIAAGISQIDASHPCIIVDDLRGAIAEIMLPGNLRGVVFNPNIFPDRHYEPGEFSNLL